MNSSDVKLGQKVWLDMTEQWGEGYYASTVISGNHVEDTGKKDDVGKPILKHVARPVQSDDGIRVPVQKGADAGFHKDDPRAGTVLAERLTLNPEKIHKQGAPVHDPTTGKSFLYDHYLDHEIANRLQPANKTQRDQLWAQGWRF